ncbi:MAG: tetratricopeptide repeat protein [Bryobacteraceae bacterium]|nr:tetratricopeptide repeat protein [Bryobacteraceae bacterium]
MTIVFLALLQTAQEPSLLDKPQFVESKFEAAVDSGAHATAGSAGRMILAPLGVLQLPASRPSASGNREARAAHERALVLEAENNPIEAAKFFARAVQLDPSPAHLLDASVHLLSHGAAASAAKMLAEGLRLHPKDANLHLALGVAEFGLGQYERARETFVAAMPDPRSYEALALVIEAAPSLAGPLIQRLGGSPYHQALAILRGAGAGQPGAEGLLQKAIQQDPAFDKPHFELALLYVAQQRTMEAIGEFEATLRLNPDHEQAHFRLAQLQQRAGRKADAETHFAAYRRLHAKRLESEEAERKGRIVLMQTPQP